MRLIEANEYAMIVSIRKHKKNVRKMMSFFILIG